MGSHFWRPDVNRNTLLAVAVVLVLVAGLLVWFFTNYEQYTTEKNLGFSGQAASNNFYAAELFLAKYDMAVKSYDSILTMKELPSTNDVLFIPTQRFDLGDDRVTELLEWVKKGGHLIVLARYSRNEDEESKDVLFERLGVKAQRKYEKNTFLDLFKGDVDDSTDALEDTDDDQVSNDLSSHDDENNESKTNKTVTVEGEDAEPEPEDQRSEREKYESRFDPTIVKVNDEIEDKKVYFDQEKWMQNESSFETSWTVDGENGAQLLEFNIDDGWVTLLSDIRFLTNDDIDKFDHAAFLHTIVHIDDSKRKLWLIRNDDSPSLISLLFTNAQSAMMMFLIFIFVWLWYASRRFGPVAPDAKAIRRSMSEHITSTGHYQWRNHNRTELLASVQKALLEKIAHTRPLWVSLSEKELAKKLAKIAGLDHERIFKAITAKRVAKELEFSAIIEVLSIIRKKL